MWKTLSESVEGTAHSENGTVCQDSHFVTPYKAGDETILIAACADGAGSASHSHMGSKLACEIATRQAMQFFDQGHASIEVSEELMRHWIEAVHSGLGTEAHKLKLTPRDLACTLLFSVIGERAAVFAQIGDGAMVVSDGDGYRPVFWPQNGEYQNTTYFVSEADYAEQLEIRSEQASIDEIAIFTDGLQMLALSYGSKTAHEPFFRPMFRALRAMSDEQELLVPMRTFLNSPAVNERTDDDKTLILATRTRITHDVV